jgi:hypothetical protein
MATQAGPYNERRVRLVFLFYSPPAPAEGGEHTSKMKLLASLLYFGRECNPTQTFGFC